MPLKDFGSPLSDSLVDACSDIIAAIRTQLTGHADKNEDIVHFMYTLGGALGGYIYTLSQKLRLPLSDAFLEGFASFRRFLHDKDENQLSMFSSLTSAEHKN